MFVDWQGALRGSSARSADPRHRDFGSPASRLQRRVSARTPRFPRRTHGRTSPGVAGPADSLYCITMTVPFYGHVRQYHNIKSEIDSNMQEVLESGQYVMG